jgi:putative FmdB family regulatory protein
MPIYDYACSRCGRVVEVVHPVDGQGPASCVVCGAAMKKLFSSPAVHFKGSGWAKKDRRSATTAKAATKGAKTPATEAEGGSSSGPANGSNGAGSAAPSPSGATESA